MKRHKNLFKNVYSFQNLLLAYKKAKRGTRQNYQTSDFNFNLETRIIELSNSIEQETYEPEPYKYFTITEPKERIISVARFADRVVHHAIVNVLEPVYEFFFINDSYATRKNKGTHKAVYKAQLYLKQNRWFLKNDIKKYFENINQDILLSIISKKIGDRKFLNLIEKVIQNGGENGKGLPIGNLTSQFFANVYLNELDYFVKHKLKFKHYVRYMDDFVIFDNEKQVLISAIPEIELFLKNSLHLKLKPKSTIINQQVAGLSFLGTRIFPNVVRVKNDNIKRIIRKLNEKKYQYYENHISLDKLLATCNSYTAFFDNYDTFEIKRIIFADEGI